MRVFDVDVLPSWGDFAYVFAHFIFELWGGLPSKWDEHTFFDFERQPRGTLEQIERAVEFVNGFRRTLVFLPNGCSLASAPSATYAQCFATLLSNLVFVRFLYFSC